jgi:hypothetical protein
VGRAGGVKEARPRLVLDDGEHDEADAFPAAPRLRSQQVDGVHVAETSAHRSPDRIVEEGVRIRD